MHQTKHFEGDEADELGSSTNQEERITARRLNKTRQKLGEDGQIKKDGEEEARKSQKLKAKLNSDGLEMLTNIQAAADSRELDRRKEQEEGRRLREKMEDELKSCKKKSEEIFNKWIQMKDLPGDLRDSLISQQKLCDQVIADKDKLINELEQELSASDYRFVEEIKKQVKDARLLSERVEEHVSSRKKSFQKELSQIKASFGEERKTLLSEHMRKWEHQMKEKSEDELKNMMQCLSLSEELADLRLKPRSQSGEDTDTEVQNLKNNVQGLKVHLVQNLERLDNTLEGLRTREKKNTILKAELKRRIVRMQDVLGNLKSLCIKQEKQSKADNQSLKKDYKRLCQQYKDMQKRARHFAARDAERFEKTWLLYEGEVKTLALRALQIDRTVHEEVLGLPWASPPLPFMERSGPTLKDIRRGSVEEPEALENTGVNQRTASRVLELLCDEMGFLEESKLKRLLAPLEKDEQSLIKLDAIFSAIGIESKMEVSKMAEFLMKYRQHGRGHVKECMGSSSEQEEFDLIHPDDLLMALKDFTTQHCRSHDVQSSVTRDSEEEAFWESMANVLPESKRKLWAALDMGLHKYHALLKERAELLQETQDICRQNAELRRSLDLYTASKTLLQSKMQTQQVSQLPDVDI